MRQVGDDLFLKVFLGRSGRKAQRERSALELLASGSLPVPRLVGEGVLGDGSPWVLLTRLLGVPMDRRLPERDVSDAERVDWFWWAGFSAGELHRVTVPAFGPWAREAWGSALAYYRERSAGLLAEAAAIGRFDPALLDRIAAAQRELEPSLRSIGTPVLVHRDLNPRNLLGEQGPADRWIRTGIIDFESSGGGDPLEDLRWLPLAEPRAQVKDAFFDGYRSAAGALADDADRVRCHQLDLILDIGTRPTMQDASLVARSEAAADRLLAG